MLFPKGFFELQVRFAQRVAEFAGLSLEEALFFYTSLPSHVGVTGEDRQMHPRWEAVSRQMSRGDDLEAYYATYTAYTQGQGAGEQEVFGCFSYEYLADTDTVRLHFANRDDPLPGALSRLTMEDRKSELKHLFDHVHMHHPFARCVDAISWLFHLDAYQRLFPEGFTDELTECPEYHTLALWGQFLDKHVQLKADLVETFTSCLDRSESLETALVSFPFTSLRAQAHINVLRDHFFFEVDMVDPDEVAV